MAAMCPRETQTGNLLRLLPPASAKLLSGGGIGINQKSLFPGIINAQRPFDSDSYADNNAITPKR